MPPLSQWYAGRQSIREFFQWAWKGYNGYRLVSTAANGQPAFAAYARTDSGASWTAHSIHVLSVKHDLIARLTLLQSHPARFCLKRLGFRSFSRMLRLLHGGRTVSEHVWRVRPGDARGILL